MMDQHHYTRILEDWLLQRIQIIYCLLYTDKERVGLNWTWRVISYSGKWPTLVKESSFVFLGIDDVLQWLLECGGVKGFDDDDDDQLDCKCIVCNYKLPNCGWDTVHGVEDH